MRRPRTTAGSFENAGRMLDINAEIEPWTRAGHKGVDIRQLDHLISHTLLND